MSKQSLDDFDRLLWHALSSAVAASINSDKTDTSDLTEEVFNRAKPDLLAAIVEAVEGIYGDSDGLREFASTGSNQVVTLREALEDMVWQFAYKSDGKGKRPPVMFTGGLSALEHAFGELGWPDPKPCPDSSCDVKGCQRWPGCGMPRPDGDYWNICGTHMGLIDMGDTSLEKKPGRGYNAKERKERLARR